MTLYMAPRQTIDVYVSGKIYTSQKVSDKRIGVDTAGITSTWTDAAMKSIQAGTAGGAALKNTTGRLERAAFTTPSS